jgi:hypothetical protein
VLEYQYQYDDIGNRSTNSSTPSLISMSFDALGRRVAKNNQRFVYDGFLQIANSELKTLNTKLQTFGWDPSEPVACYGPERFGGCVSTRYSPDWLKFGKY